MSGISEVQFSRYTGGGSVSSWIDEGCVAAGVPANADWHKGMHKLCERESSFDPNSINDWDSNNRGPIVSDGYREGCSRGIAQCVPTTFAEYHADGTSWDIYDPIANIASAIRYILDRYHVALDGSDLARKVQQADPHRPPHGYIIRPAGYVSSRIINPVDLSLLISISAQMQRRGVKYHLGAKADNKKDNPRSNGQLSTPPDTIDQIDCSGFSRYILYQAGGWTIPDGSQNQRQWCENSPLVKLGTYADVNDDVGGEALYLAFIKPYANGCGSIGHVWFVYKAADAVGAETFESYGGVGVGSRNWNTAILFKEAFEAFRVPTE